MTGGHLGEIYKICRNFSNDERKVVLLTIPTKMLEEEIDRRSNHYSDMLASLYDILDNSNIDSLDNAEATLKALREVLKV